ncbi:unknown protein [Waddlia chondrophila 2032/99]|uniref:Uncharacterized protein n=1 Tax=Waddlia chondrophila 2032/99 TaxID=765953 RepID=F8LAD4_9BACT|nr:unknown protein [Waddlia chondrophila 2032/99]
MWPRAWGLTWKGEGAGETRSSTVGGERAGWRRRQLREKTEAKQEQALHPGLQRVEDSLVQQGPWLQTAETGPPAAGVKDM